MIRLGPGAEFDLIRGFLAGAPALHTGAHGSGGAIVVGPGDDCSVVRGQLALSVDLSMEGIHFRREWLEPQEIGYRATAAALSDLAAVAAAPLGVLVSLALPDGDAREVGPAVMSGVSAATSGCGATLLGGDVARSADGLVVDVAVVGSVDRPILRAGARAGDALWVTGRLGAAAAAVLAWIRGDEPPVEARSAFAAPPARMAEARWLADRAEVHALIDLSDGLAGDAGHVAAASGVGIVLDATAVPVHPATRAVARDEVEALWLALAGGEDYELCLTAAAGALEPLAAPFEAAFGIRLQRVGSVEEGDGVRVRSADGEVAPIEHRGHDHFAGGAESLEHGARDQVTGDAS